MKPRIIVVILITAIFQFSMIASVSAADQKAGIKGFFNSCCLGPRIGIEMNEGQSVSTMEYFLYLKSIPNPYTFIAGYIPQFILASDAGAKNELEGFLAGFCLGPRVGMELDERKIRVTEWLRLIPVVGFIPRIIHGAEAYSGKTMKEIEQEENLKRWKLEKIDSAKSDTRPSTPGKSQKVVDHKKTSRTSSAKSDVKQSLNLNAEFPPAIEYEWLVNNSMAGAVRINYLSGIPNVSLIGIGGSLRYFLDDEKAPAGLYAGTGIDWTGIALQDSGHLVKLNIGEIGYKWIFHNGFTARLAGQGVVLVFGGSAGNGGGPSILPIFSLGYSW